MSKISDTILNNYDEITKLKIDSVKRKNGDFKFVDKLKELIINSHFQSQDNLWNFFDVASDNFIQVLYESITNMMENVADVDLCTLYELKNICKLLNLNNLSLFDLPWTQEIESLIDTYSVNREYVLYGKHSVTDIEEIFGQDATEDDINSNY